MMKQWFLAMALTLSPAPSLWAQKALVADGAIEDQVRIRLANDPDVKGGAFQVAVKDGVVTIRGKVDQAKWKARAEKIVKKVKGVKSVDNQLTVEPRV
jgi:osmotically-inducible protein OsmY